jgi:hypothetical protein
MTTERFVTDYMIANSELLRLVIVKRDYPSTATIREGGWSVATASPRVIAGLVPAIHDDGPQART